MADETIAIGLVPGDPAVDALIAKVRMEEQVLRAMGVDLSIRLAQAVTRAAGTAEGLPGYGLVFEEAPLWGPSAWPERAGEKSGEDWLRAIEEARRVMAMPGPRTVEVGPIRVGDIERFLDDARRDGVPVRDETLADRFGPRIEIVEDRKIAPDEIRMGWRTEKSEDA